MIHYHAPNREENFSGPREFAYIAEVDILGWKFRMMKTGELVIDTPIVAHEVEGQSMTAILGRNHAALMRALLALDPDVPEALIPERYTNVGRIVAG